MAFSEGSWMRFLMIHMNWATVMSDGTRYFLLSMSTICEPETFSTITYTKDCKHAKVHVMKCMRSCTRSHGCYFLPCLHFATWSFSFVRKMLDIGLHTLHCPCVLFPWVRPHWALKGISKVLLFQRSLHGLLSNALLNREDKSRSGLKGHYRVHKGPMDQLFSQLSQNDTSGCGHVHWGQVSWNTGANS